MIKNMGIYNNLVNQLDKVARHNRQGSFKTKTRYYEAVKRFCGYLADEYRLQKLSNISPKHIDSYVDYMKEKGLAASTIKTDLTAIRFFHDQMANTRHDLQENSELNLTRRTFGGVDRRWSFAEFERMLAICLVNGRDDYACIACLGYYAALRIEECFKLDMAQAEKAIKTGVLIVKGKGGLVREIPIQESIRICLGKMLEVTPRGHKLFVAPDDKTHLAIKRLQNFIHYHRAEIQDVDSTRPLSYHGLRHACASNWYQVLINQGKSVYEARRQVAAWLGHGRDDVTRIYLAGLKNDCPKSGIYMYRGDGT